MTTEVAETAGHAIEHALTPSVYIAKHLQDSNSIGDRQASAVDFSAVSWDTMLWSALVSPIGIIVPGIAARRVIAGVPDRFQAFAKLVVEMVDDQVKGIIRDDRSWIVLLALTVFVWVTLMNVIDLVPMDWIAGVNHLFDTFGMHVPRHRAMATAGLSGIFGISFAVLVLMIYCSFKIKGVDSFAHELLSAPFDAR